MRYQERIYIQNDNRAVRNKDILNVNMSSDICIFKSPTFELSGATKIQCGPIVCDLSGFSSENILTAATYNCFGSIGMPNDCFSSVTWTTKIYEDNELSYSGTYYTSSALTGVTPLDSYFFSSLTTGLSQLNYNYSLDDTVLTVQKQYGGSKDLQYDLCLTWGIKPTGFTCPSGFSATPANDSCQKIVVTSVTATSVIYTAVTNYPFASYNTFGARFYEKIDLTQTPINTSGTSILTGAQDLYYNDGSGSIFNVQTTVLNDLWGNGNYTPPVGQPWRGRLNNSGLWATPAVTGSTPSDQPKEFIGFSYCLDITTSGTYSVGICGNNYVKFRIDGQEIVNINRWKENFYWFHVFPIDITSGKHIIELEGADEVSPCPAGNTISPFAYFNAEIYSADTSVLSGLTGTSQLEPYIIFTTRDMSGTTFDLGDTSGYSCPAGYVLDTCGTYQCIQIINSAITATTCTACTEDCTTVCSDTFPYVDSSSTGVYLFGSDITTETIPVTFNFTGNTSMFTAYNATFSYKIFRYIPESGVFKIPPVYESKSISYSFFSGVSATTLTQLIPVSGLSIDGDYLIKGFYEADACTDFLGRLGKRINTDINSQGSVSQVYQEELDYYFVALREAETPLFNYAVINEDIIPAGGVSLFQQVIIVDDILSPPYPNTGPETSEDDGPNSEVPVPQYFRTGSTFVLSNEYAGDVVITLNGLTLSRDYDYTLTGQTLTILGPVTNGDIITIIYTRSNNRPIIGETKYLATIPSGATNNQGTSQYYYNTTTGKYEVYLNNTPFAGSNIIVILNGITLVNNIDYYQSTSNLKRIILNGTLVTNDIVTIIYYPTTNTINGITTTNNYVAWYVINAPQKINGTFYLEYSTSPSFSTYTTSDTVPYVVDLTNYSGILTLTGSVGTNYYYRVKNIKDYVSICGDIISSTAYSETVKVQIQSNAINSY